MDKNNQAYKKLKEQFSIDELGDSVMLPDAINEIEEKEINKELAALRMQRKESMTEKEQLLASLLHLKYKLKQLLNQNKVSLKFGDILKSYIKLIKRNQKQFAEEIGIHPSRLNRIIKGKEKIGKAIAYRLENHSGDIIPAIYWWKVMQKEIESEILTETEAREIERQFVTKVAYRT